jgi:hypothetical protein
MELQIKVMERDQENRMRLVEMLQTLKSEHADKSHDKETLVLQGMIDQLLEQQRHNNEQMKLTREAMLAPKKIVRDESGKAQGLETVTN